MISLSLFIAVLAVPVTTNAFVVVPHHHQQQQHHHAIVVHGAPFQQRQPSHLSFTSIISAATATTPSRRPRSMRLHGFLADLFGSKQETATKPEQPKFDPVVIEPDFRVTALFLLPGLLLDFVPYLQLTVGPLLTALGLLFLVQTFRVRFVFDETNSLAIKIGNDLQESGENFVVGGENRWDCNTIVNYEFFPKDWMDGGGPMRGQPILVYFKETQTDASTWNQGPGKAANDPEKIAAGTAVAGQVHFFPAVCNAQQIREEFEKRNCAKL